MDGILLGYMPIRKTIIAPNEYYHCYNRGTDKRKIFLTNKDHLRFVALLYICNSDKAIHISNNKSKSLIELFDAERGEPLVAIGAWCLMPNHFHLLLKETKEGGIGKFINKLLTAYSMYFNIKNHRKGTLFEGRFKAEHADEDRYLKYLYSYIHLNPAKLIDSKWKESGLKDYSKTKKFLDNYEFSSYFDFIGIKRPQNKILKKNEFPNYFKTMKNFDKEISEWLSYGKEFLYQGRALI